VDGLDKIRARILDDAQKEAQSIISEAQAKAQELLKQAHTKADNLTQKHTAESESAAGEHKRRLVAKAELDYKKELLSIKRQMLDEAFKGAIEEIKNMPEKQYAEVLMAMLVSQTIQGEADIIFSAQDKSRLGNGFVTEVNGLLAQQGKNLHITSTKTDGNFSGGFILKGDGFEVNNTLEALARMVRDEVEPLAAQALFKNPQDREEGR